MQYFMIMLTCGLSLALKGLCVWIAYQLILIDNGYWGWFLFVACILGYSYSSSDNKKDKCEDNVKIDIELGKQEEGK